MANSATKERNLSNKGKTGRTTYSRRKRCGGDIKRTKSKLPDGSWDSPQGIERPQPPKA